MSKEQLFHVGVKALIENEKGEILLLKTPGWAKGGTKDHWDIPGGRIQEGQSLSATLQREVKEETGISKIENSEFFTAVISNHKIPLGSNILGLVLMVFKVRIANRLKIQLSAEHTEFEWVGGQEASARLKDKYPAGFTSLL